MAKFEAHTFLSLPGTWPQNSIAFIKSGTRSRMYVTDAAGTAYPIDAEYLGGQPASAYALAANYYTKTNLQTSGQAQVNWGNIMNPPPYIPGISVANANETQQENSALFGYTNSAGSINFPMALGSGIIVERRSTDTNYSGFRLWTGHDTANELYWKKKYAGDLTSYSPFYKIWHEGNFNPSNAFGYKGKIHYDDLDTTTAPGIYGVRCSVSTTAPPYYMATVLTGDDGRTVQVLYTCQGTNMKWRGNQPATGNWSKWFYMPNQLFIPRTFFVQTGLSPTQDSGELTLVEAEIGPYDIMKSHGDRIEFSVRGSFGTSSVDRTLRLKLGYTATAEFDTVWTETVTPAMAGAQEFWIDFVLTKTGGALASLEVRTQFGDAGGVDKSYINLNNLDSEVWDFDSAPDIAIKFTGQANAPAGGIVVALARATHYPRHGQLRIL